MNPLAIYLDHYDMYFIPSDGYILEQNGYENDVYIHYTDYNDDFNDGDNEGMGYFPFTVRKGFRCSTAVGYLNPVKKRKNLKVVTKAY